jgi:ceramide glucosyltransferase
MSVLEIVCLVVLSIHLTGLVALVVVRRRRVRGTGFTPHVAVLKPLKGLDEGIRENLESFFGLDYPDHEIVLGVEEDDDPVIPLVRSIMAAHPGVRARLVVGGQDGSIQNPKVRSLVRLLEHVRSDFVVISDSNVRVGPDYLARTMPAFEDPAVAVVTNLIAGVGEKSLGAMLEHLHLDGYIAMAQSWTSAWIRFTSVIGKSMAVRLSAVREAGGLEPLGRYLAEDYLLGQRLAAKGYRVVLDGLPVENFNARTRIASFLDRHYRWLVMRWRINPASCILELVTIPTAWVAALTLAEPRHAAYAAALMVAFILLEQLDCLVVRGGRPMPVGSLALKPVKDLLHALVLVWSLANDTVNWRGHVLRLGWRSRITVLPPEERVLLPPFLLPMRMGDEWPASAGRRRLPDGQVDREAVGF